MFSENITTRPVGCGGVGKRGSNMSFYVGGLAGPTLTATRKMTESRTRRQTLSLPESPAEPIKVRSLTAICND